MKYIFFCIILLLFGVSCDQNIVPKPKKFLSDNQMENLIYDLSLMDATRSVDYKFFDTINFNIKEEIYKKHNIDSISLNENMIYYASFPKRYDNIIKKVENRIKKEQEEFRNREKELPPQEMTKQNLDSLIKM